MSLGYTYNYNKVKHTQTLEHYNSTVVAYTKLLANEPFITQEQVSIELSINKETLIRLNNVIRNDNVLQDYIKNSGLGNKYWNNTILPLFSTGKLQSAINKDHTYPERIGLYTGV